MKLSRILEAIGTLRIGNGFSGNDSLPDFPEITSIHYCSNEVMPGGMFFAIKGLQADGHRFIPDAVSRGAAAVVVDAGYSSDNIDAQLIPVTDTRRAMAVVASEFFGNPTQDLYLIGITGTNGKTTTAYLIEHILREAGRDVGVISTINYRYHGRIHDNPLTTPESLDLQRILAEMKAAGVSHVVMEVSSHGVALDRISHCRFNIGVYTNLSQDHLDFHSDMDDYWACKRKFFFDYLFAGPKKDQAMAVINTDNEKGRELAGAIPRDRVVTVGSQPFNDIGIALATSDAYGMTGELRCAGRNVPFKSGLIGRFNLENIACAAGAASKMGIPLESVAAAVGSFTYVPGRLERVSGASGPHVFLDYAHTPDALENVLITLKQICSGRLICVFGCGGDRDRTKRPEMGKIAASNSDLVVITSDNPRTEDPARIIEHIRSGVITVQPRQYRPEELKNLNPEKGYIVEPDREKAICLGIKIAGAEDTVLIAGKGHESYQIIGKDTLPFDDREKATTAIAKL